MNGYVCFYNGKRCEVYAETLWKAKAEAVKVLKVPLKQMHMISVILAEKNGEQVKHVADF